MPLHFAHGSNFGEVAEGEELGSNPLRVGDRGRSDSWGRSENSGPITSKPIDQAAQATTRLTHFAALSAG
jgi:hypothetical protein